MKLLDTRDNNYTLEINGVYLHSKYSPVKEAEKFVKTNLQDGNTAVVIGAGLGYIYKAIAETYPDIKIVGIPLNRELAQYSLEKNWTERYQWDMTTDLNQFLSSTINTNNISGLQIVEWAPSSKIFSEQSLSVNNKLLSHIRVINGNLLTTARFGRLWLKNSIRNFLITENYISIPTISKPVVIAASGVSLSRYFKAIHTVRDKIFLVALSSATMALMDNKISPDLVFSTDPGYYSKLHLNYTDSTLAIPLSNSSSAGREILLLNQGNFFEQDFISEAALPALRINENGTVAGTALDFALRYSSNKIYLIGQDLETSDIISHVSPYAFEKLLENESNKINPLYSIMYKRYINQGVTYKTYRDWFSSVSKKYPQRISRVSSSSLKIDGIEDIDETVFIEKLRHLTNCEENMTEKNINFIQQT